MTNKQITWGLVLLIIFQTAVLAAEYLNAVYPLWLGKEIRLKVVPVDPRSLFRGNYARLNYAISRIDISNFTAAERLRNEEVVYISLKPDQDNLYVYNGISLEPPASGEYIRGRLQDYSPFTKSGQVTVKYGIEAWFAPRDKALYLEQALRDGGIAVVMVTQDGKAALKAIEGLED